MIDELNKEKKLIEEKAFKDVVGKNKDYERRIEDLKGMLANAEKDKKRFGELYENKKYYFNKNQYTVKLEEDNKQLIEEISKQKELAEETINKKESIIEANAPESVKIKGQHDRNIKIVQDELKKVKKEKEKVDNI